MATKELRITAVVLLPDDAFEHATLMAEAHPIVKEFETKLRAAVKQPNVKVEAAVVKPGIRGARASSNTLPHSNKDV